MNGWIGASEHHTLVFLEMLASRKVNGMPPSHALSGGLENAVLELIVCIDF